MATVYLVYLVDSSLTVALEWKRILVDYLQPTLARLGEGHYGFRVQTAFVTYATADSIPSPLLARKAFCEPLQLIQAWRGDLRKLGIGHSAITKSFKTAALEGFVAVLELFDDLPPKPEGTRTVNRLIHISAAPRDDAKHPQCNTSMALDKLSWEDLPAELKKRNIIVSGISLIENPKFMELYKSVSNDSQQPWFQVAPGHHLYLAGFPPGKNLKRSPESQTSPDAKRTKTAETPVDSVQSPPKPVPVEKPPAPAPAPVPAPAPASVPPPQPQPQPQSQPPSQPQPQPQSQPSSQLQPQPQAQPPSQPAGLPPISPAALAPHIYSKVQQLMLQVNRLSDGITKLEQQIPIVTASGDTDKANRMQQEVNKVREHRQRLLALLNQVRQRMAAGQSINSLVDLQNTQTANPNTPLSIPSDPPQSSTVSPQPSSTPVMNAATIAQVAHQASAATQVEQANLAAQIQRLTQQNLHRNAGVTGPPTDATLMPKPNPALVSQDKKLLWQGAFAYAAPDPMTNQVKEFRASVGAFTQGQTVDINVNTWPNTINVVPNNKSFNSGAEIMAWVKRLNATITYLSPHSGPADKAQNEHAFVGLVRLLVAKKTFAAGGWTAPSGSQKNSVIIFPLNPTLVAAFLTHPSTAPAVPTPVGGPPQLDLAALAASGRIPPAVLARLQALPPEQRIPFLRANFQQLQRQQQQQQQQAIMAASGLAAGNGGAAPNLAGGVSLEMLQSFMQRKPPGAS